MSDNEVETRPKLAYERPNREASPSPSRASSSSRSSSARRRHRSSRSPSPRTSSNNTQSLKRECRVYVGNLAYVTSSSELKSYFSKVGEVIDVNILMIPNTNKSKGCAIVEFATAQEAEKAISELNESVLDGRPLFLREDRMPEERGDREHRKAPFRESESVQVFVGNLPFSVEWQELKDLFRDAGSVIRADVLRTHDRRSRGCGFVTFETQQEAQKAITMFDGYMMGERRIEVREDKYGGRRPPPREPYSREPYGREPYNREPYNRRRENYDRGGFGYPPPPRGASYPPRGSSYGGPGPVRSHSNNGYYGYGQMQPSAAYGAYPPFPPNGAYPYPPYPPTNGAFYDYGYPPPRPPTRDDYPTE